MKLFQFSEYDEIIAITTDNLTLKDLLYFTDLLNNIYDVTVFLYLSYRVATNDLDWISDLVASGSLYTKFWSPTVHFW